MSYQLKPGVNKALKAVLGLIGSIFVLIICLTVLATYTSFEKRLVALESKPILTKIVVVTPTPTPAVSKAASSSAKAAVKRVTPTAVPTE